MFGKKSDHDKHIVDMKFFKLHCLSYECYPLRKVGSGEKGYACSLVKLLMSCIELVARLLLTVDSNLTPRWHL